MAVLAACMADRRKTAIIIGAGPAGLTAALELLKRTDIHPIVIERSEQMGGLAQTVNYKGFRMDLGGHRFFSKSERVMRWWFDVLPLQRLSQREQVISYQGQHRTVREAYVGPDPIVEDQVMLLRQRRSRIYFAGTLFDYPLRLTWRAIERLGWQRMVRIAWSYLRSVARPIRPERSLEDFFINRFGRELYYTFFKSYTEKVWGRSCREISAEWGRQRIKGLSFSRAVWDYSRKLFRRRRSLGQRSTETSLIDQFLYPKYGPGQMWDEVARLVRERGGDIVTGFEVSRVMVEMGRMVTVGANNVHGGAPRVFSGDFFFSTMPVRDLIVALDPAAPEDVASIAHGLPYRDFITVGLLLRRFRLTDGAAEPPRLIPDNWVYVQEPGVMVGRIQIFNNWSPALVADPDLVWIGLEYFCYEGDALWHRSDAAMREFAIAELVKMGMVLPEDVLDGVVVRVQKAYPAYWGTYGRFGRLRSYLDGFENLYLLGRNGMHKYNNQDHSMLTAMVAVDNIAAGRTDKANIWAVNTEQEYHEHRRKV